MEQAKHPIRPDTAQEADNLPSSQQHQLDFVLDIPLDITVELGRSKVCINELLALQQGSVLKLDKLIGEPLDIYANGKLIAKGEAVVIKQQLGIRLLDVISPTARVKQLANDILE